MSDTPRTDELFDVFGEIDLRALERVIQMHATPRTDEVYDNNRGAGLAKALRKHAKDLERELVALSDRVSRAEQKMEFMSKLVLNMDRQVEALRRTR